MSVVHEGPPATTGHAAWQGPDSIAGASRGPRSRGAWIRHLPLLGGGFLVGLLVLELVVRVLAPNAAARQFFIAPDLVLHHRFIPASRGRHWTNEFDVSYTINALGLRDREVPLRKPAGTKRILMLGDSFTEGDGVEQDQTFSSRIQALLDQDGLGGRWQVLNAGVGSYSPLLEYLYLKNGGLALQPDLVILNFDLSDVYDDVQYSRQAVVDARGDPVAVRPLASAFTKSRRWRAELSEPESLPTSRLVEMLISAKDSFKEHFRLYGFVRNRIATYVQVGRRADASGDIRSDKFAMLRPWYEPTGDHDWSLSLRYLTMIRGLLAERGIDLWVTVYPYGLQVSPREWGAGRRSYGFEVGRIYTTAPQDYLERFCRRQLIPVVNLCEPLRAAARTTYPLYYDLDGHWRPAGHQLVANVLYWSLAPYLRDHDARAPDGTATPPR